MGNVIEGQGQPWQRERRWEDGEENDEFTYLLSFNFKLKKTIEG